MNDNRGFTLIEIIGAVIILGIISILAILTFTGNLRGFRDDYYNDMVRTVQESGKEFFNDNRKYRPSDILGAQIVPASTLITQNYIDELKDYNGDRCSNDSYAIIIKVGKDDYEYHSCIRCPEDSYSNYEDKYCDSSWMDPTTVEYGIDGISPNIYVYLGTPRSELRDKLELPVSYVKKNSNGEVIATVKGTGFDDLPTIYPTDMDVIDTNKLGVYTVNYEYGDKKITGKVTVYENENPTVSITKENIVATNLNGGTRKETGFYTSGEWAQKIYVTLNPGASSVSEMTNQVSRFQWYKDGKWEDFYVGNSITKKEITTEMNETVRFRSIDINGNISKETEPIIIRIDNTKPICELGESGTYGDDKWYTSDVVLNFKKNEDLLKTRTEAISGVKVSNITISTGSLSRTATKLTTVHNTDTKEVTYIGYVEDNARNFTTCSIKFKRDVTAPTCTVKIPEADGDLDGTSKWHKMSTVKVEIGKHEDAISGVKDYGINTWNSGKKIENHTADTTGVTYKYEIRDNAGNSNTCSVWFKKDSTKPTCTAKIPAADGDTDNGSKWHKMSTVKVEIDKHEDKTSGVKDYGIDTYNSKTKTVNHTADTTGITYKYEIRDKAGNSNTCSVWFKKDSTKPTCELQLSGTMGSNSWYVSNVDVSFKSTNGTTSGVASYGLGSLTGNKTSTESSNTSTSGVSYTGYIKDKAGNSNTCATAFKIDKSAPTCTVSKTNLNTMVGVTTNVKCTDKGSSGCSSNNTTGETKVKASVIYKIKDNAGNQTTCDKIEVKSYQQDDSFQYNCEITESYTEEYSETEKYTCSVSSTCSRKIQMCQCDGLSGRHKAEGSCGQYEYTDDCWEETQNYSCTKKGECSRDVTKTRQAERTVSGQCYATRINTYYK